MKKLSKLMFVLALGGMALTSCKKEGCTDPNATNYDADAKKDDGTCLYENALPLITDFQVNGASGSHGEHAPGDTVMIHFVASDDEGALNDYTITELVSGGSGSTEVVSADITGGSETVDYTYVISESAVFGSTITLTIAVTDSDLDSATMEYMIHVECGGDYFCNEVVGTIYHVKGSLIGAWDMIGDSSVPAASPSGAKDMANTDNAGSAFSGSWNGDSFSKFVKDNTIDFDNIKQSEAATAYAAGSNDGAVNNPAVGDTYIAKLRSADGWAVIKVETLDPTNNDCSCTNKGKMTFTYRK